MQLFTAGLLIIQKRRLLLAYSNNKKCFYLPGGKINEGESTAEALCREVAEELHLSITTADLAFYMHITAPAYGEADGIIMEQDCFFVHKTVNPVAAAEIGALRYFSLEEYVKETNIAPGAVMVLQQLQQDGYID